MAKTKTCGRRLRKLIKDVNKLYAEGDNTAGRCLFYLCKASLVLTGDAIDLKKDQPFKPQDRQWVKRTHALLSQRKRPMTGREILNQLKEAHRSLADVQYHTFYPTLREATYGGRKTPRRLAECGVTPNGTKRYGLAHWKCAEQVPAVREI